MLQHSDGFDSHATGATTLSTGDAGWTGQAGVTIVAAQGPFSGNVLRRAAATLGWASFSIPGAQKRVAAWFRTGGFGGAAETSLLETGAGVRLLTLDNLGYLRAYDGAGTLRATSAGAAMAPATWTWVEIDFEPTGIFVWVGAQFIMSYVGAYTAPSAALRILGAAPANTPITDVDDLIAWDETGSFFTTTVLSPRRIQLARPSAAGAYSQWTPTSGANWQAADAATWAGGVGNTATAAGQADAYEFTDLAALPGVVDAVVVKSRVVNNGAGAASIAHLAREAGGIESLATAQTVPVSVGVVRSTLYRDPLGVAWTGATINAAQFGQKSS